MLGTAIALAAAAAAASAAISTPAATPASSTLSTALVTRDQAALRASPRDSAGQQAVLWAGETVEVRGERLDYVQVWDHKLERGGFVRASDLRRMGLTAADAPELLSLLRFVRDTPGSEAFGIGLAAAYIQAAPAMVLNSETGIEALDALGTVADRLAQQASAGAAQSKAVAAALSAHLDVARGYGVGFTASEREGRIQICYDGDAFRRVLAMHSNPEQRARAVLALSRPECAGADLKPSERKMVDEWRAGILDQVDVSVLAPYVKNRVLMRRASVWAALAYQRARNGENAGLAANRAISDLGGINKAELPDADMAAYNDAAIRVNASRWAAMPATAPTSARSPGIVTTAGATGETCIALVDAKHDASNPLAKRCTYGLVWTASATLNREGNALALAVQPLDAWRELWVFRKQRDGWSVSVLPPATVNPGIGYAEFAGWVPGGKQMLIAREARGEGKYKRSFELTRLDTLIAERQSGDAGSLGAFRRWQDPAWKRQTVSMR
jgi:hypothetical protein